MTSKEALKELRDFNEIELNSDKNITKALDIIEKDLEVLENINSKTTLMYIDRKRITQEYEKWCKVNYVMINDLTNVISWLLCFKLKEWLEK